jgi:CheY-like chemotaxis protein
MNADPILIVDDCKDDLLLLQRALEHAGIKRPIVALSDGEEVVRFLTDAMRNTCAILPRLLFVDLQMPRMNGFDVLRWLREHKTFADLKAVVVSGCDRPEDVARARELGAADFLVKIPSPEIIATVTARLE